MATALGVALLVGVVAMILLFALIGVQVTFRRPAATRVRTPGEEGGSPAVSEPRFLPMLQGLIQTPLWRGHRVELLTNGDTTYPRLWHDLRTAQRSITVQAYAMNPGEVADTLRAILCERARSGVRVLFLADALGAEELPRAYCAELRRCGVETAVFRPARLHSLYRVQHRAHTRTLVIDGEIGYTGGFGISDQWRGNGRNEGEWRDTNVRFTGPAVIQLQTAFAVQWEEATGTLVTSEPFFPLASPGATGGQRAGLLLSTPSIGSTLAERFLAASTEGARRTLYVTNSYFAPNDYLCDLLRRAAGRGVDVRVLTTSRNTDRKAVWRAGRARYEELLAAGVRIFEYQPCMMHAKTLVVDGTWSAVGSLNLDNRGIALNSESTLIVHDRGLGDQMDALFAEDLTYAEEIRLETFRSRPRHERLLEHGASLLSRLL